jgi:DMSO reductase family type II enzyme heme b subunit
MAAPRSGIMATARGVPFAFFAATFLLVLPGPAALGAAQDGDLALGQEVYDRWCAACHGFEGAGDGPAAEYMLPRPRDFTRGLYQIRTTAGGEIPTDDDILRVINEGMPGTTMPGWESQLPRRQREALVAYIKSFYPPFETLPTPQRLEFGRPGRASDDRLAEGRIFYDSIECWQCHGDQGRGDGPSVPELEDDWGFPSRPADLTKNWLFGGGGSVEDIYRALLTGLDGSPMPANSDLLDAGFMTEEQLWSVAHYVRSLSPERMPRTREVIRVERAEPGEVPGTVADERWEEVESFYIPLVGQIIISPRWFDPAVNAVFVQAVHDGEELALRLTWNDRSRSPDPAWRPWQERILDVMEPKEGDPVEPGERPDRIAVQFPPTIPIGMDRPYFLMGNARNPVYLWQWRSDRDGAQRATAQGMRDIAALDEDVLVADADWEDGRWQVVLRRPLRTDDGTGVLQFETGVSIPVAFFAWDGDNGEEGTRGAVSSWFFVHLEQEVPASTYVAPLVAFLLTGGMGLLVVARAQRRERQSEGASVPAAAPADGGDPPEPPGTDHATHSEGKDT